MATRIPSARPWRIIKIVLLLGALWGCQRREVPQELPAEPKPPATIPPITVEIAGPALLDAGACFEGKLQPAEIHVFYLTLEADEYLHLSLDQRGVDVAVNVVPSMFSAPLTFDSPTGKEGTEHVVLVAAVSGEYRFELRAWAADPGGNYQARVKALRPATLRDRRRAEAVRVFYATHYGEATDGREAETYARVARLFGELGETILQARALFALGEVHVAAGRLQSAADAFEPARDLFQQLDDARNEAATQDQIGDIRRRLGDLRASRQAFEAALELWRRLKVPREEGTALSDLGLVAKGENRFRLAVERYQQALEIWERLGDRCAAATTRANLGTIYALFGESLHAWDNYQQVLDLLEGCQDSRKRANQLAITLTRIGDLLADQGKTEEARESYKEALVLRRDAADRRGEAVTLNSLALVLAREDPRAAFEPFRSALEIFIEIGELRNQATLLRNLAELYESVGDLDQARTYYERALEKARRARHRDAEALALLGLARRAYRIGDFELARHHAEHAVRVVETVREAIVRSDLRSSYLARRQGYYDVLIDALIELHRIDPARGDGARAFVATERARARSLLDTLAGNPTPGTTAAEATTAVNAAYRDWLHTSQTGTASDRRRIEVELRRLLERLRGLTPGASGATALISLAEVRGLLDEGTLFLAYHLTPKAGWLWAITPAGASLHQVPGQEVIVTAAAEARRTLQEKRDGPALDELARLLLGPVADQLTGRRLAVVGPSVLQSLPFAALPDPCPDAGSRPLGIAHEIVHLPSATVLRELRERARRRPAPSDRPRLVAVADPVFGDGDPRLPAGLAPVPQWPRLEPLPASRREAEAILQRAPAWLGGAARGYFSFDASRELFLDGSLDGTRLLHLATHTLLDVPSPVGETRLAIPEMAEMAALVFSRRDHGGRPISGYLHAYEIRDLDLAVDLVVLSACRTALGENVRGEGPVSLTRAFLTAGARQVIATLWDVDDRAIALLMEYFYDGLAAGRPVSRALREARAAMWQQEEWRAPYYWAGVVLQGDWMAGDTEGEPPPGKFPADH